VRALVGDFDGDGVRDAFAIVRTGEGDPGQLVYFRGNAGPGELTPTSAFEPPLAPPTDPRCAAVDRLVLAGPGAVLVELGARCPPSESSAPDRWIALARAASSEPAAALALAATVADPPGAPALSVDADVSDRDRDGRPDVALRVTLEGGGSPLEPGPRVSATLAWLDRPAGLSRDTGATESSFATLAAAAAEQAIRAKDAPGVPAFVAQARALWRAACADGGTPRLVGVLGTGAIPCGSARSLEALGLAEARAYVTMGDALRAALSLDRAERPPAAHTAARAADARGWIAQIAPPENARTLRTLTAVPLLARGHELSWGPLAFERGGALIVRTRAGPVRVDPASGEEAPAERQADWPAGVVSPDGSMRWIETYDPCDGVALRATFASGDDLKDVALPVPPPLGDRCVGSRGAPSRAIPFAWGPGGVQAFVEGDPVLVTPDLASAAPLASFFDQPVARGSPRSPDGKSFVVAAGAGLVVGTVRATRLLRAADLSGAYVEQQGCAVSDDETEVACVHAGKAWLGTWAAP
jgi:hypothetical protein